MRVAIMGTRGVPAEYGGFETFARELSVRLAQRGHDVTVYCRTNYVSREMTSHEGVELVVLPVVRHKYLETVGHTLLSVLHGLTKRRFDVVLICNAANAFCAWIPRLRSQKVVLNVDGMEWKRKKWNLLGKAWYKFGAFLATKAPNAIVTDADVIKRFYAERFGATSTMIPYGASTDEDVPKDPLSLLNLRAKNYFLYVSRLEPENNAHLVVEAFRELANGNQLALIGSAPYAPAYVERVRQAAAPDQRIVMPGGVYGEGYRALQAHALAYVHATEVGGTHPALVEAMAAGNCVLTYETPENLEVIGDAGLVWRTPAELRDAMTRVSRDPQYARDLGRRARDRARLLYSWDAITERYEQLFDIVLRGGKALP